MPKGRVQLVSLAALLLSILTVAQFAGYTSVAQETKTPNIFAGDPALKEVANYRQWTRVNDVPLPVTVSLVTVALLANGGPFI